MSGLFSESVTLLGRGGVVGRNATNDPVYGDSVESEAQGWVDTSSQTENTDQANTVTTGYTLWLDGSVDITAYDRVRYRGQEFNIKGVQSQPGGSFIGGWTSAKLEKVTG